MNEAVNEGAQLASIAEVVIELLENRDMVIVELATCYRTPAELADWIRSLPTSAGTPHRLRIPADDPSSTERAALYLAVAELIDPLPMRQLATLDTSIGRHTFVVENRAPLLLDPRLPRDCLDRRVARLDDTLGVRDVVVWTARLAEAGAAHRRNGPLRVQQARTVLERLVEDDLAPATLDSIAWLLGLAESVARDYGEGALDLVRTATRAIAELAADALLRDVKLAA